MEIYAIESLEEIHELKQNWDSVYRADSEAQFFVSWVWISGYLERNNKFDVPWLVLAAKENSTTSEYIAFFPLQLIVHRDNKIGLYSQLGMAGVTDSLHQGFICVPGYELEVAQAFAQYLQNQETWTEFEMRHIQKKKSRLTELFHCFDANHTRIIEDGSIYKNELDDVDNSVCPYVLLPNDWEEYLAQLGSSTRKSIRKKLKKFTNSNDYYITHATQANINEYLNILFDLWRTNWESRKGKEKCSLIVESWLFFLRHCFEHNCLFLPVLWHGDKPAGAVAHFIDIEQRALLSFISARDESFNDLPPGLILHSEAIRFAISNGFHLYDFLMGNEGYKYSFNAQERYITTIKIHRKESDSNKVRLNWRTIPQAFQISETFHANNSLSEAIEGYRKILTSQPDHLGALYGLAVVRFREQNFQEAEILLKQALSVQPFHTESWFSLGNLYQREGQLCKAISAYQRALETTPTSIVEFAIQHNLGYVHQQRDSWEEAIACYHRAKELQPDSAEAEAIWANAMYAQGKLSPDKHSYYAELNYQLGESRRHANDSKTAIEYYQQAIALNPNFPNAHFSMGKLMQELGQLEKALIHYQKAHSLNSNFVAAELGASSILQAQGKLSKENRIHFSQLILAHGIRCRELCALEDALEYFYQAISMNPDLTDAFYQIASTLSALGDNEQAVRFYEKTLEFQPEHSEAVIELANARHALGSLDEKQLEFYAQENLSLGRSYHTSGELEKAIKYYRQALTFNPDLTEVRHLLRLAVQENSNTQIKVSTTQH